MRTLRTLQSICFGLIGRHSSAFAGYYNPKLEAGEVRQSAMSSVSALRRELGHPGWAIVSTQLFGF
jgi:hypothetical protein